MRKFFIASILVWTFCAATFAQTDEILPCPTIDVSGPSSVNAAGDTITFTANVTADNPDSLTYNWTVSKGTIIEGLNTPVIRVATNSEVSEEAVTATVEIKGLPDKCDNTASTTTQIPYVCFLLIKTDDYERMPFREEKQRLANVAFELKQEDNFALFIIIHLDPKDTYSSVKRRITNISKYLLETHKISGERIQFRFSEADKQRTEIYILPIGETDGILAEETRLGKNKTANPKRCKARIDYSTVS